jgi:hypothetical protein
MIPIQTAFLSGILTVLAFASASARAQTVLWADDFEDGPSQWSTTGLWHWIRETNGCASPAVPFPTSTHCMWYGIDGQCNYDNGGTNTGKLRTLQSVTLPDVGQVPVLRYRRWRSAEGCGSAIGAPYDWTEVKISAPGLTSAAFIECDSWLAWRKGHVDLTPFLGADVTVEFFFDSFDGDVNSTLGVLVDDVVIQLEPGRSYCPELGCPCPSPGVGFHTQVGGCRHSQSLLTGAELLGSGTPSVASDDVVLTAVDMPATSFVTFLQGTVLPSEVVFGDGLRCIGGSLLRIATRVVAGGAAAYPMPGEVPLSIKGLIPAGGMTVGYQAHYRDSASFCTPATFNLTNAYEVAWNQ